MPCRLKESIDASQSTADRRWHQLIAPMTVIAYHASMNSKHKRTLKAIFSTPISGTIAWNDVESLLIASGAEVVEGSGSRVRFVKDQVLACFHRPHPAKEAKRYQIRDARAFLEQIGVRP